MSCGYDMSLPDLLPFKWVERRERIGNLGILAFGAFEVYGLVGSEKGGVALVLNKPAQVLATIDIPWDIPHRRKVVNQLLIEGSPCEILDAAQTMVIETKYGVREFEFRFEVEELKAGFRRNT